MENFLTQTLVYLGAAVVSVPIAKRLGLGSVLGYLIAGVVIGPFALSLVGDQADVMKFAEFGVVILLFLIGLEVQPSMLWDMRKAIFGLGGARIVVTALAETPASAAWAANASPSTRSAWLLAHHSVDSGVA